MSRHPDLNYLEERIALGSQPADLDALRALGFTHILNLRGEHDESDAAEAAGLRHLWVNWEDERQASASIVRDLDRIMEFLDSALAQQDGRVLIHCAAGIERTPRAAYVFLRLRRGMGPEEAIAALRAARRISPAFLVGVSYAVEQYIHDRLPSTD